MKIFNKLYNLKNKSPKDIVLISDIHYYDKKDINSTNSLFKDFSSVEEIDLSNLITDNVKVINCFFYE